MWEEKTNDGLKENTANHLINRWVAILRKELRTRVFHMRCL